jgi:Tol biopolymer transport system component
MLNITLRGVRPSAGYRLSMLVASFVVLASFAVTVLATPNGLPSVAGPVMSPDGRTVAFAATLSGRSEIWLMSSSGQLLGTITQNVPGDKKDPSWSPDGKRVAFAAMEDDRHDIWTINSDGLNAVQLTNGPATNDQPTWFPDGSRILFVSRRAGNRDVWAMNADGSGLQRVTRLAGQANHPSVSPDGTRLVFSLTKNSQSHLQIGNVNGSGLGELTTGDYRDLYPSWGPAGILFSSNRGGAFGIWIIQPDDSELQQVATSREDLWDPAWVPGTAGRLIFSGDDVGGRQSIYTKLLGATTMQAVLQVEGFLTPILIQPGAALPSISATAAAFRWRFSPLPPSTPPRKSRKAR